MTVFYMPFPGVFIYGLSFKKNSLSKEKKSAYYANFRLKKKQNKFDF